jgi:aspartyl-tRNA synthetase
LIRKARVGRVLILGIYSGNTKPCALALREDKDRELFTLVESLDVGSAICFEGELASE